MYQPGISRLAARSIYNKAKQMAIIENKAHEFRVLPKDGDEYFSWASLMALTLKWMWTLFFTVKVNPQKDAVGSEKMQFRLSNWLHVKIAEAEESIGLDGNHDLKVEDFATQRCFLNDGSWQSRTGKPLIRLAGNGNAPTFEEGAP
jgi:hypothetical protein